MTTVISEFNTRVQEIDKYFEMLERILLQDAQLYFPNKATHKIKAFDDELIKILKANCFLLLYNLIESSVKSSITTIYDHISANNKKYSEVVDEIKKIWIQENYKNFKERSTDFIFQKINEIADDVISVQFESDKVISGNIDGLKIREFAAKYGFSARTHRLSSNGVKLHQVKTQRNLLAHGSLSFSECGRQYTYEDLASVKSQVIIYLRGILKNIQRYLDHDEYLL